MSLTMQIVLGSIIAVALLVAVLLVILQTVRLSALQERYDQLAAMPKRPPQYQPQRRAVEGRRAPRTVDLVRHAHHQPAERMPRVISTEQTAVISRVRLEEEVTRPIRWRLW